MSLSVQAVFILMLVYILQNEVILRVLSGRVEAENSSRYGEDTPKFYIFQSLRLSRPKYAVTETYYNRITWLRDSPSRVI
jgi:hypothetical protein